MAAEDEPRPRPCGIVLWQTTRRPRRMHPQLGEPVQRRGDDQVRRSAGHHARLLRRSRRAADSPATTSNRTRVAPVQRQPEAVEPGTEVRAGRRDLDARPMRPVGRSAIVSPQPPRLPRRRRRQRSRRPPTVGETSAVSTSLSPWPVTVTTICCPAIDFTAALLGEQSGDPGGGGRLDEDAVARGEQRLCGEDLLVADRLEQAAGLLARPRSASSLDAGLPMRIAVATVSGSRNGLTQDQRRGSCGLESPHPRRPRVARPARVLRVTHASTPRYSRRCRRAARARPAHRPGRRRSRTRPSSGPRCRTGLTELTSATG